MPSRRKSRQRALQILYLWEARGQTIDEAIESYYDAIFPDAPLHRDPFAAGLVRGAASRLPALDERISKHAEHWRLERMPAVDRNIIRLAVYELTEGDTPAAVVIDEALELARKFSGKIRSSSSTAFWTPFTGRSPARTRPGSRSVARPGARSREPGNSRSLARGETPSDPAIRLAIPASRRASKPPVSAALGYTSTWFFGLNSPSGASKCTSRLQ